METETKVLGGTLIIIALFTLLGSATKPPTHECEIDKTQAYCFEIRDRGDKENYRCLYDEFNLRRYYSCSSGWEEIPKQVTQPSQIEWACTNKGCI